MTFDFTYRPLIWLGPVTSDSHRRSRWTFKARWEQTLPLLERELEYLGVSRAMPLADFSEPDITRPGTPRGKARQPKFPGIKILSGHLSNGGPHK